MRTLFDSPDLLVIDKPAGLATIPDRFGSTSVHDQLEQQIEAQLWVVHRLDRETTGVLAFARTAEAHRKLSMAFEQHRVTKTYQAWTSGERPGVDGTALSWHDLLMRGKKRSYSHPAGKDALTEAVFDGPASLAGLWSWTLQPRTGRNHQLRVQLASRGWPIAGDALYGSAVVLSWPGIALRAVRLEVPAGILGPALVIDAGQLPPVTGIPDSPGA